MRNDSGEWFRVTGLGGGGGGGGGAMTGAAIQAAIVGAVPPGEVVFGQDADGDWVNHTVQTLLPATVYDALVGTAFRSGMGEAAALARAYTPLAIASGVATISLPDTDSPNLTLARVIEADASFALEFVTPAVALQDHALDVVVAVENTSAAPITMSLAAPAANRAPIRLHESYTGAPTIAAGATVYFRVMWQRGEAVVIGEPGNLAVITPEAFGADPTGVVDSTAAFNAAMQFAVASKRPGRSSGIYKMSGTLTPGGRYVWDWGDTQLNWAAAANSGATITGFTEIMENPTGSATPQGSGKRVLFNTAGCTDSVNAGVLTITGATVPNMRLANRSAVNAAVVAISAASGSSGNIVWSKLMIFGCGHALWQGDQRGTAPNILPYTRWVLDYLHIQYCLQPIVSGQSGNGLDDMWISNLRMTRNAGTSIVRGTDLSGGIAFLNGLAPSDAQDYEAQTIATTAASAAVTLSADNAGIVVGTVLAIDAAGLNKAGGAITLVAKVTAKAGTAVTLDKPVPVTAAAARFACNPPEMLLQTSSWHFARTYLEELHLNAMRLADEAAVYGGVKVSNGDLSGYYDCGILLQNNSRAEISLHEKSANNAKLRAVVGVASTRTGALYSTNCALVSVPTDFVTATVNSDPLMIVTLAAADLPAGADADASAEHNGNLVLSASFTDGVRHYQRGGTWGAGVAWAPGQSGALELGPAALITAATASGNCSAPAGGTSVKTAGGTGYLQHAGIVAGKKYRITINISVATNITGQVRWHNAGALIGAGTFACRPGVGRYVIYQTAPATANQMRFFANTAEDFTITELTIAEVL